MNLREAWEHIDDKAKDTECEGAFIVLITELMPTFIKINVPDEMVKDALKTLYESEPIKKAS
jgi:hypothetical protein